MPVAERSEAWGHREQRRGVPAAWSCGMEGARSASAAFFAQKANENEYRQGRSSVIRRSWKQCFSERSRVKRSFTRRKRAGRGYMPSFVYVDTGCLAAMNIAACAGVKRYALRALSIRFYDRVNVKRPKAYLLWKSSDPHSQQIIISLEHSGFGMLFAFKTSCAQSWLSAGFCPLTFLLWIVLWLKVSVSQTPVF